MLGGEHETADRSVSRVQGTYDMILMAVAVSRRVAVGRWKEAGWIDGTSGRNETQKRTDVMLAAAATPHDCATLRLSLSLSDVMGEEPARPESVTSLEAAMCASFPPPREALPRVSPPDDMYVCMIVWVCTRTCRNSSFYHMVLRFHHMDSLSSCL